MRVDNQSTRNARAQRNGEITQAMGMNTTYVFTANDGNRYTIKGIGEPVAGQLFVRPDISIAELTTGRASVRVANQGMYYGDVLLVKANRYGE